jgi:hypothetical protein
MKWYIREASTAIYVSNIPLIWPLIRRVVPGLASTISSSGRSRLGYNNGASSGAATNLRSTDIEMSSKNRRISKLKGLNGGCSDATVWESDSQERIVGVEDGIIRQEVTVTVESEKAKGWDELKEDGRVFGSERRALEYTINIESRNNGGGA